MTIVDRTTHQDRATVDVIALVGRQNVEAPSARRRTQFDPIARCNAVLVGVRLGDEHRVIAFECRPDIDGNSVEDLDAGISLRNHVEYTKSCAAGLIFY